MGLVVVTDHVFPDLDAETRILEEAGHRLRFDGNLRTPDEVIAAASEADGVLNCYAPIPAEAIQGLVRCRVIARYGIGLDTIDIAEASSRGIVVTNVPDYCIDEVSDHALALILSLVRRVAILDRDVRAGGWDLAPARPVHRLRGRTLGLVGFGRIARRLAEKVAPIGLRRLAHDPFVPVEAITEAGCEAGDLERVLVESDIVSIHAPLMETTRHLIGDAELRAMKPDAFLVNTSRGPLVDLDALRTIRAEGHLGGVGLDVLESEPPAPNDPLLRDPGVVITPHAAFYSEEATAEQQRKAAEQVVVALAGDLPRYAVNPEALSAR
ncbi:MAG TPA: C-terminal binding protein [Actinomycetota bacterium]|jgi:D-3-phosphoglycerate dehydrogenase